jgi:hypothetical protein
MSEADRIQEHVEVQVVRLFAGREPSAAALARCPTLKSWRLRVDRIGFRRWIVIGGTLASGRFTIKNQPPIPTRVLWMDRRWRSVPTAMNAVRLSQFANAALSGTVTLTNIGNVPAGRLAPI